MSDRISDERLSELFEEAESDSDEESAFGEIMDHRRRETALLLELRALAERMRGYEAEPYHSQEYAAGAQNLTHFWLSDISSLLATQQACPSAGESA